MNLNVNRLINLSTQISSPKSNNIHIFEKRHFMNNNHTDSTLQNQEDERSKKKLSKNYIFRKRLKSNLTITDFVLGINRSKKINHLGEKNNLKNQMNQNMENFCERTIQKDDNNLTCIHNNLSGRNKTKNCCTNPENIINLPKHDNKRVSTLSKFHPQENKGSKRKRTEKGISMFDSKQISNSQFEMINLRNVNYNDMNSNLSNDSKKGFKIFNKLEKINLGINNTDEDKLISENENTNQENTSESTMSTKNNSNLKFIFSSPPSNLMTFTIPDSIESDKINNDQEKNEKKLLLIKINDDENPNLPKNIQSQYLSPKLQKHISLNSERKLCGSELSKTAVTSKERVKRIETITTTARASKENPVKIERRPSKERKPTLRFSSQLNCIKQILLNQEFNRSTPGSPKKNIVNFNYVKLKSDGGFASVQETKLNHATSQNKPQTPGGLGFFKNGITLNKFLIRDFLIGETGNQNSKSKMKMKLTRKMYEFLEKKKFEKIKRDQEAFEIEKDGKPIEENSLQELTQNLSYENEDLNQEELKAVLEKMDNTQKDKTVERSKQIGELIENISNSSYDEIDTKSKLIFSPLINTKNLERVIRIRNIIKKGIDLENDLLEIKNINKFKEQKREYEAKLMMTLKNLGPPSFLKTKFKNSTMEKYKIVNGRYFGCKV